MILAQTFPANTHYQACFTPQQRCTALIVEQIRHAKKSIYLQAYSFTSRRIAHALADAKRHGIQVKAILDKSDFASGHFSYARYLMHHHIPVWQDNQLSIAHNKVMIFDQKTIETGSFNFTYSAQHRNAENVLIIQNKTLAAAYLKNWFSRQKQSVYMNKESRDL